MKDSDIINLYKKYQSSRMADSEDEIMRIVAIAHKKVSAPTAVKTTQTANNDEEHVTALFNTYQQQRDPHREKITATVMAAARQNIQQRHSGSAKISHLGKTFFSAPRKIMAALHNRLSEAKPTFQWQMAAPALALVAVIAVLVPQMTNQNELGLSYADNGISAELLKQAPQLVATIQHSTPMAGFGFSDAIDPPSAAFQLGTMTTDLYIISAADDSSATLATTINIQRIITQSGINDALLATLENLNKDTNKTSPNSEQVLAIAHDLEHYFSGHTQEAMFRFGKWLEASLLATQSATGGASSQPLKNLLMQWQQDGKSSALDISSPIAKLIADLDDTTVTGESTFDEIRKLHQQLLQIKAALQ